MYFIFSLDFKFYQSLVIKRKFNKVIFNDKNNFLYVESDENLSVLIYVIYFKNFRVRILVQIEVFKER